MAAAIEGAANGVQQQGNQLPRATKAKETVFEEDGKLKGTRDGREGVGDRGL